MFSAVLVATLVGAAYAATPGSNARGFDAVPVKAGPTADGLLTVEAAKMPVPGNYRFGALFDSGFGLLALRRGAGKVADVLPFRSDLRLVGSYQSNEWLEVAAELPLTLHQAHSFARLADLGLTPDPPMASAGLGDARLFARAALAAPRPEDVGIAGVLELRLPTGNADALLGERGVVVASRLVLERQSGSVRLLANAGARLHQTPGQWLNLRVDHELTFGAGAEFALQPTTVPLRDARFGSEINLMVPVALLEGGEGGTNVPAEVLLYLRGRVWRGWEATVGVGRGLSIESGYGREAFRVVLGVLNVERGAPESAVGVSPEPPETAKPLEPSYRPPPGRSAEPETPVPEPCPEQSLVRVDRDHLDVRGAIRFATDRALIEESSFPLLDAVFWLLKTNASLGPVLVEGHTDDRGTPDHNQRLSQMRAQAVVDYLVRKGISPDRLRAEGRGADHPVADNSSEEGRAQNRRTEFWLMGEVDRWAPDSKAAPNRQPAKRAPEPGSDAQPLTPDFSFDRLPGSAPP